MSCNDSGQVVHTHTCLFHKAVLYGTDTKFHIKNLTYYMFFITCWIMATKQVLSQQIEQKMMNTAQI